jgi:hypothetical protein
MGSILQSNQFVPLSRTRAKSLTRASALLTTVCEPMPPFKQYKRNRQGSPDAKENQSPTNSPANIKINPLFYEYEIFAMTFFGYESEFISMLIYCAMHSVFIS